MKSKFIWLNSLILIDNSLNDTLHDLYYCCKKEGNSMETTRVFTNGRSQAVRIPKAYRFEENEVYINKIGDTVILAPKKKLAEIFLKGAAMLDDDFLSDGVPESIDSKRKEL